jgi:hypothetical protein
LFNYSRMYLTLQNFLEQSSQNYSEQNADQVLEMQKQEMNERIQKQIQQLSGQLQELMNQQEALQRGQLPRPFMNMPNQYHEMQQQMKQQVFQQQSILEQMKNQSMTTDQSEIYRNLKAIQDEQQQRLNMILTDAQATSPANSQRLLDVLQKFQNVQLHLQREIQNLQDGINDKPAVQPDPPAQQNLPVHANAQVFDYGHAQQNSRAERVQPFSGRDAPSRPYDPAFPTEEEQDSQQPVGRGNTFMTGNRPDEARWGDWPDRRPGAPVQDAHKAQVVDYQHGGSIDNRPPFLQERPDHSLGSQQFHQGRPDGRPDGRSFAQEYSGAAVGPRGEMPQSLDGGFGERNLGRQNNRFGQDMPSHSQQPRSSFDISGRPVAEANVGEQERFGRRSMEDDNLQVQRSFESTGFSRGEPKQVNPSMQNQRGQGQFSQVHNKQLDNSNQQGRRNFGNIREHTEGDRYAQEHGAPVKPNQIGGKRKNMPGNSGNKPENRSSRNFGDPGRREESPRHAPGNRNPDLETRAGQNYNQTNRTMASGTTPVSKHFESKHIRSTSRDSAENRSSGQIPPNRSGQIPPNRSGQMLPNRGGQIPPNHGEQIPLKRGGQVPPNRGGHIPPNSANVSGKNVQARSVQEPQTYSSHSKFDVGAQGRTQVIRGTEGQQPFARNNRPDDRSGSVNENTQRKRPFDSRRAAEEMPPSKDEKQGRFKDVHSKFMDESRKSDAKSGRMTSGPRPNQQPKKDVRGPPVPARDSRAERGSRPTRTEVSVVPSSSSASQMFHGREAQSKDRPPQVRYYC